MDNLLLLDAAALFAFHRELKSHHPNISQPFNYGPIVDHIQDELDITFDKMVAFVAINREHRPQLKFCEYLRKQGYALNIAHYQDAYVGPNDAGYQRLSSRISYTIGLMERTKPHVVVVTDAFDTFFPMWDYTKNRQGLATLAFFRSGLESRWEDAGVFQRDAVVDFVDLDPLAHDCVGVNLTHSGIAVL